MTKKELPINTWVLFHHKGEVKIGQIQKYRQYRQRKIVDITIGPETWVVLPHKCVPIKE